MKKIQAILLILVMLFALGACASPAAAQKGTFELISIRVNDAEVDAAKLDEYFSNDKEYKNYAELKQTRPEILSEARNITPAALKGRCEVYKFTFNGQNGFLEGESFLVFDGEVYKLGQAFGGYGVSEFAYIKTASEEKLYYVYSYGSGIHYSRVVCFDFLNKTAKQLILDEGNIHKNITFGTSLDGKSLDLYYADVYTVDGEGVALYVVPREKFSENITKQ